MEATIKLNQLRHSAKKLRPVARLFVGKKLEDALNGSQVMPQDSARFIYQGLLMAKAAATQKELSADKLVVMAMMATEGPKIKRMRPNARGRSNAYLKHLAHLTITVGEVEPIKKVVKGAKQTKEKS